MNKRRMLAAALAAVLAAGPFAALPASAGSGVNVGSLNCKVAGGSGFIFGSTKSLSCLFTRHDGTAERYHGEVKKYGVDLGFTQSAYMIWLVFAPGQVKKGALAGDYAGVQGSAAVGLGLGANVLLGGSNDQIALQPASVEGVQGLNVAAGFGQITLKAGN
ncbi:MAG TPA: DUF992 domain-containing protein [Dongiaceae bacterium]|nr:DUF992 domain-containing protein [Dongiaceae bacterium]